MKKLPEPQEEQKLPDNIPVIMPYKHWEKYFQFPSTGTLKYLLLRRKENGFDKCVRRISGRLYLDVKETLQFLNSQRDV